MAIQFKRSSGNFKLISSTDPAIGLEGTDEEKGKIYDEYAETLDEGLLLLTSEPTRFVVKKALDYATHKIVKGAQLEKDGKDMKVTTAFIMEQVRQSLVDIENPPGVETDLVFTRDSDGRASKELIADLETLGIVMEIYTAQNHFKASTTNLKKR